MADAAVLGDDTAALVGVVPAAACFGVLADHRAAAVLSAVPATADLGAVLSDLGAALPVPAVLPVLGTVAVVVGVLPVLGGAAAYAVLEAASFDPVVGAALPVPAPSFLPFPNLYPECCF